MLFTELKNYVVFDLEMNGSNQIIEIGALKVTTGQDIEKFSGDDGWITLEMIQNGMAEERALTRFMKFVGDYPVVGHAIVDGDVQLIKEGLRYNDLGKWKTNGKVFDTQQIHRALNGNPNDISLAGLADEYEVEIGTQKHRALADSRATLAVFAAMQKVWAK